MPKMKIFLDENHWGSQTLTLPNVHHVLGVLNGPCFSSLRQSVGPSVRNQLFFSVRLMPLIRPCFNRVLPLFSSFTVRVSLVLFLLNCPTRDVWKCPTRDVWNCLTRGIKNCPTRHAGDDLHEKDKHY